MNANISDLWWGSVCPAVASRREIGRVGRPAKQIVWNGKAEEPPLLANVVAADAQHFIFRERRETEPQTLFQDDVAGPHPGLQSR